MKAFISSTYADLIEHRKLAAEALERLDQQVGRMEVFGARTVEATTACLAEIEACNIFVGIYAHRYGYIPPDSQISITEVEYNYVVEHNKIIFCFIVNEDYPWPPRFIEDPPGRNKLQIFKSRIESSHIPDTFTTAEDLGFKIGTSIGRYLAQNKVITQQDLLLRYWDIFEQELQDVFALAYNQSRRDGSKTIKTRYIFAAMIKLMPELMSELLQHIPNEALPEPIIEDSTAKEYLLIEQPNLSSCVTESIEHIGQRATPTRKLSVEDVFVDIAKHGTGFTVSKLRKHGISAQKIDQLVRQLKWDVIER